MFPPYFYIRFSRNQLFFDVREQIKGPALLARTRVLLSPTGFAFRPFRHQKSYPKFRLGPACLAFRASQMPQPLIFRSFDVRLTVSDVPRSTPTTPSVLSHFGLLALWPHKSNQSRVSLVLPT